MFMERRVSDVKQTDVLLWSEIADDDDERGMSLELATRNDAAPGVHVFKSAGGLYVRGTPAEVAFAWGFTSGWRARLVATAEVSFACGFDSGWRARVFDPDLPAPDASELAGVYDTDEQEQAFAWGFVAGWRGRTRQMQLQFARV